MGNNNGGFQQVNETQSSAILGSGFMFPVDGDTLACTGMMVVANDCCWDTGDYYEGTRTFSTDVSGLEAKFVASSNDDLTSVTGTSLGVSLNSIQIATFDLSEATSGDCFKIPFSVPVAPGTYTLRISFVTPIPSGAGCVTLGDWLLTPTVA